MLSPISMEREHDYVVYAWDILLGAECVATYQVKIFDETPQYGEVHNVVTRWTKDIYVEFLLDFEDLKEYLKLEGVNYLVAGKTDGITKWEKYISLFGFDIVPDVHRPTVAVCRIGD